MRTCFIGALARGLLCGVAGLGAAAASGQNVTIDVVGRYHGTIYALDVAGDYAYVSDSWNFAVIDVSNPAQPVRRGLLGLPYGPEGISVSGTLAYVADYSAGFYVIDVSQPSAPTVRGSCATPDLAVDVQFSGSAAYVAAWSRGLQAIDVSNPDAPRIGGSYDTPDIASRLCISGGRAYVADSASGIQILDISAPYTPARLGSYNTPDSAEGVFVLGDTAYVADWGTGLLILDVSNPAGPRLLGGYNTPGSAANLVVSGNLAYVADWNGGLRIVDVTNPGAPVSVGSYATGGEAVRVALSGGLVYMTTRAQGLWIFRVTVPDTTPPVITLLGDNPVVLVEGTAYLEPGFTATDDVDGDITGRVTVTGSVDPAIAGTYMLRYEVADAAGNPAEARTRRVDVVEAELRLFRIGSLAEDAVEITWSSRAGSGYAVLSCTDLIAGAWTQEAVMIAQGDATTWTDPGPLGACRYYRIERCVDTDHDGVPDPLDGCPSDSSKTEPGACGCGVADTDTDGDTVLDCNDLCPLDPLKTEPGACGCGVPDTDTDGDTVADCNDRCSGYDDRIDQNANGIPDGCEPALDADGDGTPDAIDGCPLDPLKIAPGICGCGAAETDTDGDTVPDCTDLCPEGDDRIDTDGDHVPDCLEPGPEMALIPAGSFEMGDVLVGIPSWPSEERPVHTVYVSLFYLDKYEVTKAMWDEVRVWALAHGYAFNNQGSGKGPEHPVQSVSWYDVVKWCNARSEKEGLTPCYYTSSAQTTVYRTGQVNLGQQWVKWDTNGYRLPTEAEWEKSARGGAVVQRHFPWKGNTISRSDANYSSAWDCWDPGPCDGFDLAPGPGYDPTYGVGRLPYTSPVGSFAANAYGLYDMAGNAREWCWDWYDAAWYGRSRAAETDCRGPDSGSNRVLRGGSWQLRASLSRCTARDSGSPAFSYDDYGFRCARGHGDADGDGVSDPLDGCPWDPGKIEPGACGCGVTDADTDGDTVLDCNDLCPLDPLKTEPGACGCGVADTDTDGDTVPDCNDQCAGYDDRVDEDGNGIPDGCELTWDTDDDGTPDWIDGCPLDALKIVPGACGCGVADTDTDGDTVPDCNDPCPLDPLKTEPGACGCGVADTDGDTVLDCADQCEGYDDRIDQDGDGIPDECDIGAQRTLSLPGGVPLVLVLVPPGSLQMGSGNAERSRRLDEGPVHTVTIAHDFYMGKYEVTQAQWTALMGGWPGTAPSSTYGAGESYPAYNLSWNDAKSFVTALNNHIVATGQGPLTVRLPTEAEWEYACRAGTQARFSFGDSLEVADACEDDGLRSRYMWYCGDNSPNGAKPVGTKLPNAFGLYAMHGNVWEWCEDWYHASYSGAPADGSAWILPAASGRVIRGGSWEEPARMCRSAVRFSSTPTSRNCSFGFRVAAVE